MITDGTISNVDIADSATIADRRLATITTAGKVSGGAISSGTVTGTTTFAGSGGIQTAGLISSSAGVVIQGSAGVATDLRLNDANNTNFIALKAPDTLTGNITWTLPATDGSLGQVLQTSGTGILSWTS